MLKHEGMEPVEVNRIRVGGVAGDPSCCGRGIDVDPGHRPHGDLRSRRGGGNSSMFGKTASLCGVVILASGCLLSPRGHS
jgi:hypothetical protein